MTNIIKGGQIIRTSQSLRGIIDYARVSPVVRIESCPIGEVSGTMRLHFKDGAESRANFSSYKVMLHWIARRRSWKNPKHVMQGPPLAKPMQFRDLATGDEFTMKGSNFDLGKVYRKTGKLNYRQSNGEGLSHKIGSIAAHVQKAQS